MEKQTIYFILLLALSIIFFLIYLFENHFVNDRAININQNIDPKEKRKFDLLHQNYKTKYYKRSNLNSIYHTRNSKPIVFINCFPKNSEPNINKKFNFTIHWKTTNSSLAEYSWIGIYPYAQSVGIFNHLSSFYLHKKIVGSDILEIPSSAGYYDVKYIQDNNHKALQTQGPIVVNPTDSFIRIKDDDEIFMKNNLYEKMVDVDIQIPKDNMEKIYVDDDMDLYDLNLVKNYAKYPKLTVEWKIGGKTLENLVKKINRNNNKDNSNDKKSSENSRDEDLSKRTLKENSQENNSNNNFENINLNTKNFNIKLCLTILGSTDSSECLWTKNLKSIEELRNKAVLEVPQFAGYFYFRILLEKDNQIYESKEKNLVVSEIFKVSSDDFILLPDSLNSVVGSSLILNYYTSNPSKYDWIGLFSLYDIKNFMQSVSPIRSTKFNNLLNNYGNFSAFLPPNSQAGQFVFVYFKNQNPLSISDIIEIQQPKVTCPNENLNILNQNKINFIDNILNSKYSKSKDLNLKKNKLKENSLNNNINDKDNKFISPFGLTQSKIKHLIIICTENHSFDSYYGNYCEAEPFSNPKCNIGPECCEKPPSKVNGFSPKILNDTQNMKYDPNHNQYCELCEINNGKMDGFVEGCSCSTPDNFAVSDKKTVEILHEYTRKYAMSDMFFQPSAGASSQNDMYLARGSYVFTDNRKSAIASIGSNCWYTVHFLLDEFQLYYDPTITSLLSHCNFTLKTYTEGYHIAKKNFTGNPCYPNGYDSADIPFNYYAGVIDKDNFITDYLELKNDLRNKTLPEVSFIKPLGNRTAHPSFGDISSEMKFVKETVDMVMESDYNNDTLILYVPDESGGYYDHVPTPETNIVDNEPYGPRIPFVAIGKFAKKNYISHTVMEHSSIIKFIEWNWLSGETGQLNTRDRNVNGIGDLIDPEEAGIIVP